MSGHIVQVWEELPRVNYHSFGVLPDKFNKSQVEERIYVSQISWHPFKSISDVLSWQSEKTNPTIICFCSLRFLGYSSISNCTKEGRHIYFWIAQKKGEPSRVICNSTKRTKRGGPPPHSIWGDVIVGTLQRAPMTYIYIYIYICFSLWLYSYLSIYMYKYTYIYIYIHGSFLLVESTESMMVEASQTVHVCMPYAPRGSNAPCQHRATRVRSSIVLDIPCQPRQGLPAVSCKACRVTKPCLLCQGRHIRHAAHVGSLSGRQLGNQKTVPTRWFRCGLL